MITMKIKHDFGNGKLKNVTVVDMSFRTAQMFQLGLVGLQSIKDRTARGIGSDDAPMPPLSDVYGVLKYEGIWARSIRNMSGIKWAGVAIRDLRGPGFQYKKWTYKGKTFVKVVRGTMGSSHMMDDLRVTYASPTATKIDITTTMGRTKARANEARIQKLGGSGWWGFSPQDKAAIMGTARDMFGEISAKVGGFFNPKKAYVPKWMDPLGLKK